MSVGESRKYIDQHSKTAAGQVGISGKDLKSAPVFLPPLPEQRRIVAKIEALQTRSRAAREALDAVGPLLDKFRQSVLAAAFRGDLTADWRAKHPDVEPASALLERIRKERRRRWEADQLEKMQAKGKPPKDDRWKAKYEEPKPVETDGLPELPEGWCWASLEEFGHIGTGATPRRGTVEFWQGGDVPWVTSAVVNADAVECASDYVTGRALEETNLPCILQEPSCRNVW